MNKKGKVRTHINKGVREGGEHKQMAIDFPGLVSRHPHHHGQTQSGFVANGERLVVWVCCPARALFFFASFPPVRRRLDLERGYRIRALLLFVATVRSQGAFLFFFDPTRFLLQRKFSGSRRRGRWGRRGLNRYY